MEIAHAIRILADATGSPVSGGGAERQLPFRRRRDVPFSSRRVDGDADLERLVGAPLFEGGQRARLTPLAQTLRPLFTELLNIHDRVLRDAQHMANAEAGSVTLAVVPFLAEEWLPQLLRSVMKDNPQLRIRVADERSRHIRSLVAEGIVDIGIGAHLVDDPKLEFHPVATEHFGIVCRMDHRLARAGRTTTWKALTGERLIGNDSFETLLDRGLGEWIQNQVISLSTRPSMMDCVRQGVGITILPSLTKPTWAPDLAFIPLTKPKVTRIVGIMTRPGQTLLPAASMLFEAITHSLKEYARVNNPKILERRA